jgi:hypothetical protein
MKSLYYSNKLEAHGICSLPPPTVPLHSLMLLNMELGLDVALRRKLSDEGYINERPGTLVFRFEQRDG